VKGETHTCHNVNRLRRLGHDMNCVVMPKFLYHEPQSKNGKSKRRRIKGWRMREMDGWGRKGDGRKKISPLNISACVCI